MRKTRPVLCATVAASLAIFLNASPVAARDLKFTSVGVAPWAHFEAETGRPIGVFADVTQELETRTGHHIAMDILPFARIERELESGNQDCTIIIWNEDRGGIVERGATVADFPIGVVGKKGVKLTSYDDLYGLSISVLRGARFHPQFDADAKIQKDFDTDYLIGIQKMVRGRVDGVAGAIPTIRYQALQEGYADYLGDDLVLSMTPLALQCSRKSPHLDLLPDLNQAIEAMHQDGTMKSIFAKNYFM